MASLHRLDNDFLFNVEVDEDVPLGSSQDAFDLRGSNNILWNCRTKDNKDRTDSHCDHIQLIPTGKEPNGQYFGAVGKNNAIVAGGLDSNGSMQGIFSSDGCQENLYISDQVIDTKSDHEISINGLLSGTFKNNRRSDGSPVNIVLEPLRIGGGLEDSFYVLSFKDREYKPINSDQHVVDNRSQPLERYPGAKYIHDFDLNLFREISENLAGQYESVEQHLDACLGFYDYRRGNHYISIGKTTKREIKHISIHCTATPEGRDNDINDVRNWHVNGNGWSDVGYHYLIRLDGTIEKGRPLYRSPAAVSGYNKNMIAIVYVGGIDKETYQAKDTRTSQQKLAMDYLVSELRKHYPDAELRGHNEYPNVQKSCPCFSVNKEYGI